MTCDTTVLAGESENAAIAPFRAFVAGINAKNIKAAVSECTRDSTTTDELAPFHWGSNGCEGFARALFEEVKKSGQTEELMTLGTPVVVEVAGSAAYASIPGHLTFKTKAGKPGSEDGIFSIITIEVGGKWKVASWSWATTKM
jgi:hypothetical protein